MKKPYLNKEERFNVINDTLKGSLYEFNLSFKKYEREMYRKYWIFAWILIRLEMKKILKPLNKKIRENFIKSNKKQA